MAELHELRKLRKRSPLPIPADACRILACFDLPLRQIDRPRFRLRRCKEGTEIMFTITTGPRTAFSWNVSYMQGVYPPSFSEARKWVHAYAAGFGQTIDEERKERMKAPVGEDRKLLRAGGCKESWLRSDVPTLFAEAAVRCKHAGAFCMSDGYCHFGTCNMQMDPEPPPHSDAPGQAPP